MKTEDKLKDRFFLEEIVHRLKNNEIDYVETLTSDWLSELVRDNPLTEIERQHHITEVIGLGDEFSERAYFKSELHLKAFLNNVDLDEENENVDEENHSITDVTQP